MLGTSEFSDTGLPMTTPSGQSSSTQSTPEKTVELDEDGFETSAKSFTFEPPPPPGTILSKIVNNGSWKNRWFVPVFPAGVNDSLPTKANQAANPYKELMFEGNINRLGFSWNKSFQAWACQYGTEGQWDRLVESTPNKFPVRVRHARARHLHQKTLRRKIFPSRTGL